MRRWRCIVCNYVHEGDAPPEKCPICNADRSKFVEVTDEAETAAAGNGGGTSAPAPAGSPAGAGFMNLLTEQMVKFRSHPISAHIPNGVLPVAVVMLFLGLVFSNEALKSASCYNMAFVVFAMPIVAFSGYLDWQTHYGGVYTSLIVTKIVCAVVIFLVGLVLVLWQGLGTPSGMLFVLLHLIMLAAAVVAGYLGGKLVFGPRERSS